VLEGGCGRERFVNALSQQGYKAIGIDFAPKTVARIKEAVPELDVRIGDVRSLPIDSGTLDGYISAVVIEHFWDGYDAILAEMLGTMKSSGFLFVSFPYMSPLRRWKAKTGCYESRRAGEAEAPRGSFYQFVLPWQQVARDLGSHGFALCEAHPWYGI
jgi:SAM-dependent methyltransferase